MPILPQIALYGQAVGQIRGQHPIRRPRIYEPCIDGIGTVRHPDRAEMSAVFVGGIRIFLKLEPPRTHSLQQPNQLSGVTGGRPDLIPTIAKAAVAVGVDGLFIETHPRPSQAKSDGANMLQLDHMEPLLEKLVKVRRAIL